MHRFVGRSVCNPFFFLSKNGRKWSKMTFHISAGFLFQPFALNLSFNLPFTILLLKSFFHNLYLFHNHYLTIFPSQCLFHNLSNHSFTDILSQSLFRNPSFTISLSQSFFHNFSFTIFLSQSFFHNLSFITFISQSGSRNLSLTTFI